MANVSHDIGSPESSHVVDCDDVPCSVAHTGFEACAWNATRQHMHNCAMHEKDVMCFVRKNKQGTVNPKASISRVKCMYLSAG